MEEEIRDKYCIVSGNFSLKLCIHMQKGIPISLDIFERNTPDTKTMQ